MGSDDLRKTLRLLAETRFLSPFGVADLAVARRAEPNLLENLPETPFTRAIVFGIPLQRAVLETIVDRPTPLYFHNSRQANYRLDSAALETAAMLQTAGHRALALPASQIITREPMRGHVSHRVLAWAAGLGWWGRNNLLVNPLLGSQLRLVSVLTDAPVEADAPMDRDCGTCVACVRVCPADAIMERREEFRLDLCYRKLCEFTKMPFIGQHICGICVKACHPDNWPKGMSL